MSRLSRREFLILVAMDLPFLAAGALPFISGCSSSARTLNFYNWSNYISPEIVPSFEREYGVRVNHDVFSSQDVLFAKIRIGITGYDLIVTTDYMFTRMRQLGLLQPVDQRKIPNLSNLDPIFRNLPYDKGNSYAVPYLWGTTGIGYNKALVKERVNSWKILWNQTYAKKISMLDEHRDVIGATLKLLGYSGNSRNPKELEEAKNLLLQQKELLKHYTSDTYIDELASNDSWLAQGWSGDVFQAMKANPNVDYAIPREGSFIWVDNLCIPKDAPHREIALSFMNYVLAPENHAKIANFVRYSCPNKAAMEFVDPKLKEDPRVYPPEEVMKKLEFFEELGEAEKLWTKIWSEVKARKV